MKRALIFAAVAEAVMGVALLLFPSLVGQLLLGQRLSGVAIPLAGIAGMAVLGLGFACWPGPPRAGMLIYSALVAFYVAYLGAAGGGVLLWPAVILHLLLTSARTAAPPFLAIALDRQHRPAVVPHVVIR